MSWSWNQIVFTFRSGSSFPDKANKSVVFPELGGPNSNVILQNTYAENENDSQKLVVNIQSPMHIIAEVDFSPSRLDDSTNIFKDSQVFLFTWKNMERI